MTETTCKLLQTTHGEAQVGQGEQILRLEKRAEKAGLKRHTAGCHDTGNPGTWEAEPGRSRVWGQPGLYSKPLSQNHKMEIFKKPTRIWKKYSITNQGYANWLSSYPLTEATIKGQEINIGEEAGKGDTQTLHIEMLARVDCGKSLKTNKKQKQKGNRNTIWAKNSLTEQISKGKEVSMGEPSALLLPSAAYHGTMAKTKTQPQSYQQMNE